MVPISESVLDGTSEDANSSSNLSSNKMTYNEVQINLENSVCNQFCEEFKELTLNCDDPISSSSQSFQNGTSRIDGSEVKSYMDPNNILNQKEPKSNSHVNQNSNLANEIPESKLYPPDNLCHNEVCQNTSLSHPESMLNMKEGSRNKIKPFQNKEDIQEPVIDVCAGDNSNEEFSQQKTRLLTNKKSIIFDNSNKNVKDSRKDLSDKNGNIETNVKTISNKSSEKQKFSCSDIAVLSSRINDKCFLSKETLNIHCLQNDNASNTPSSLSPSSLNSTESKIIDLAEKVVNIVNISEEKVNVESETFKEISLDNGEKDDDDNSNDSSDKCSHSKHLWNSRGLTPLQIPGIPEGGRSNENIFSSNYSINTLLNFHTFPNSFLSNTSENYNSDHPYVTKYLDELKEAHRVLGIQDDCIHSPTVHSEAYPMLISQSNQYQQLPVYNSNSTSMEIDFSSTPSMPQSQTSPSRSAELTVICLPVHCVAIQPVVCQVPVPQIRNNQVKTDGLTREDFSKTGVNGSTRLHDAAERNDVHGLQALLKKLDQLDFKEHIINLTNNYQQTALHLAVKNNFPSIVHVLIKHGADVNKLSKSNGAYDSTFESPLHLAAYKLQRTLVKELLLAKDINLDLKNSNGQTALHCAVQSAETDKNFIIRKLIKEKANPSVKDEEQGKNILMYAIEFDDHAIVNDILKSSSREHIKEMLSAKSNNGETCFTLMKALDKDHELFSKRLTLAQRLARELQGVQPRVPVYV